MKLSHLIVTTVTLLVGLSQPVMGYGNQYGDPPQFARPIAVASNTGFTATGAPDLVSAVNEQTPDCNTLYCSYISGGPSSDIVLNLSAMVEPALYDATTQTFNQTLWISAIFVGTAASRQLRYTMTFCSTGGLILSSAFVVTKVSYLVWFARMSSNISGHFDDLCVEFTPFGLSSGEAMRIAWTQFMLPPAAPTEPSGGAWFIFAAMILGTGSMVIVLAVRGKQ